MLGDFLILLVTAFVIRRPIDDWPYWVRQGLLGLPGFLLWLVVGVLDMPYGFFLHAYQTEAWSSVVLQITCVGLIASRFGWAFGSYLSRVSVFGGSTIFFNKSIFFWLNLFFLVFFAFASGTGRTSVLEAEYGSELSSGLFGTGMFPALAVFVWLLCYMTRPPVRVAFATFVFVSVYVFLIEFILKGRRLEILAILVGLMGVYWLRNEQNEKWKAFAPLVVAGIAFSWLWGFLRISVDALSSRVDGGFSGLVVTDGYVAFPTVTNIGLTILLAVKEFEFRDLLLGKTYLDYFARTLPEFIYPQRPDDLSATLTLQGGMHELAEAYANFGALGAAIVPLVVSTILAFLFYKSRTSSFLLQCLAVGMMSALVRGVWYQTFAIYKSFVVFSLYLIFIVALVGLFSRARGRS